MTLSDSPRMRLLTLCALYAAQGIPWGFVVITLSAYLASQGLSTTSVGEVMALSTLPWTFKWVWGPIIDRYGIPSMGRRRPWILLAQMLMVGTIAAMILIGDLVQGVGVLGGLIFVHNCFNSLQDVAVDALAVDLLEEHERGRANGLMYGSKYLGGAIGGAGMATVLANFGLQAALLFQTVILGAIFLFPLLLRERPGERLWPWSPGEAQVVDPSQMVESVRGLFAALFRAFGFRSTVMTATLALMTSIGTGVLSTVAAVFFTQHLGWSAESLAQVQGGPALAMGLFGSVGGGFLADRFGARKMMAVGMLGLAVLWTSFALLKPWWHLDAVPTGLLMLEPGFASLAIVSMFSLCMTVSWPKVAATQFTAYMALLNLSTTIGHAVAGPLDTVLDFDGLFFVGAAVQVIGAAVLLTIDPGQTRRLLVASDPAVVSEPHIG